MVPCRVRRSLSLLEVLLILLTQLYLLSRLGNGLWLGEWQVSFALNCCPSSISSNAEYKIGECSIHEQQ